MSDDVSERKSATAGEGAVDRSPSEFERLVARSSLGTPEAVRLRGETPAWLVRKIAKRTEEAYAGGDLPAAFHRDGGLAGADLAGADLSDQHLQQADLSGADLSGADLSDAQLQQADLSRANLTGAILVRAALDGARLHGTNLDGATFFRARMDGVHIVAAHLRHAQLKEAVLRRATIEGADLTGADLARASLRGATVTDSVLAEANVAETDFDDARISRVDLSSCLGIERGQLLRALLDDGVAVPAEWPGLRRCPAGDGATGERERTQAGQTQAGQDAPTSPVDAVPPDTGTSRRVRLRPGTAAAVLFAVFVAVAGFAWLVVAGPKRDAPSTASADHRSGMPPAQCSPESLSAVSGTPAWRQPHASVHPDPNEDVTDLLRKRPVTLRTRPAVAPVDPGSAPQDAPREVVVVQVRKIAGMKSAGGRPWEEYEIRPAGEQESCAGPVPPVGAEPWSTLEIRPVESGVDRAAIFREPADADGWMRIQVQPVSAVDPLAVKRRETRASIVEVRGPASDRSDSPSPPIAR
jgi:uncharacterized protein YjbI with pentapeptide repeats